MPRPLVASRLLGAAGALLVAGCCVAAWLGGIWGTAAALFGFAAYLAVFARGLDQLPVDWKFWREEKYMEFHEDEGTRRDRGEEDDGGTH